MLHKIRGIFLGFIVWLLYKALYFTWKIELHVPPELSLSWKERRPFVLAHFHGDEAALLWLVTQYRLSTMVSTSKDGEMMNTIYKLLGGRTSRGSSTRGGVSALKGLLGLLKRGSNTNIAVDGPKGPIYEVKPGVFELSRLSKSEIYAGGVCCKSSWYFPKSWNKAYLPKPFARIVIVWTGPLGPITKHDDPRSPELAKTLQNQLFAARHRAAILFGDRSS